MDFFEDDDENDDIGDAYDDEGVCGVCKHMKYIQTSMYYLQQRERFNLAKNTNTHALEMGD